jgi:monofunctional biosynthetic peptidoglycan transglycosylase
MIRHVLRAVAVAGVLFLAYVVALRCVAPPITPLMLRNAFGYGIAREWVDLDRISPALVRAVIASEDARFFEHHGIDWPAVERARAYNARHGDEPRRGGSTITMQCARNVFLWQGKSWVRKTLEAGLAYAIEVFWGKRRVLEVYLNVIEWGPGVYGAEAAARVNFRTTAARLDPHQAALLVAALPNPLRWRPSMPTRYLLARAALIQRRAAHVSLGTLDE